MKVEDYYPQGKRWWVRLHEKGGKRHDMPTHHNLEHYLDEYIRQTDLAEDAKSPLFRTAKGKTGELTDRALTRNSDIPHLGREKRVAKVVCGLIFGTRPSGHESPKSAF